MTSLSRNRPRTTHSATAAREPRRGRPRLFAGLAACLGLAATAAGCASGSGASGSGLLGGLSNPFAGLFSGSLTGGQDMAAALAATRAPPAVPSAGAAFGSGPNAIPVGSAAAPASAVVGATVPPPPPGAAVATSAAGSSWGWPASLGDASIRAGAAPRVMVSAANPHAVEAGLRILRAGGSAVDAAVAVQATLGLVEPQSSGLGGGAFLVHYDAKSRAVTVWTGRETAPAGVTPDMFVGPDGKPLGYRDAVVSGRAVGVPGAVAMLGEAQKAHGKLPWRRLFDYPLALAEGGFIVSPRLAGFIASNGAQAAGADAQSYFNKAAAGDRLLNPAYGGTLRALAKDGAGALYSGPIARAIVTRAHTDPRPGSLTLADLAGYRPVHGEAVCGPYRVYIVCTAAPPSSGAAVLQALAILERTDIASRGPADPQAWYLIAEAERLMYADRDKYVADPAFVAVPLGGLLDPAYVDARARLIGPAAGPPPLAGEPEGAPIRGRDATREPAGTSHFVIVDAAGNVVSMTTTVESLFGSGRMAAGFFLNNQMTDFSYVPVDASGAPVANAVAPGKRPRSSMAPVIVLDRDGRFVAAVGSPGGNSILAYNLKTLVGVLDWKLSMQDAIELPNLIARGASYAGEVDKLGPAVVAGLAARGISFNGSGGEGSGVHGVIVRDGALEGGADPRREGVARGF